MSHTDARPPEGVHPLTGDRKRPPIVRRVSVIQMHVDGSIAWASDSYFRRGRRAIHPAVLALAAWFAKRGDRAAGHRGSR